MPVNRFGNIENPCQSHIVRNSSKLRKPRRRGNGRFLHTNNYGMAPLCCGIIVDVEDSTSTNRSVVISNYVYCGADKLLDSRFIIYLIGTRNLGNVKSLELEVG